MDSSTTRVVQTSRGIQAIIDRGQPGERLPSEVELARQLTVSRVTVREALNRLWLKGLVTRRWGAGTFISERHVHLNSPTNRIFHDLEEIGSLPQQIANTGHTPAVAALTDTITVAPDWVRDEFELADGGTVRLIERCLTIDRQPAIVFRDYVPQVIRGVKLDFDGLKEMRVDFASVFRQSGLRLVKQVETLAAILPDDDIAAFLGVTAADPVMHAEQRSYEESGEIVMCTDSYFAEGLMRTVLVRTITG